MLSKAMLGLRNQPTLIASLVVAVASYDRTVGKMLARLEQAIYCGEVKFNRWDVGDSIVHGPNVDTSQLRFVTSQVTDGAAGIGRMIEPDGCFVAMQGTLGEISPMFDAMFWLTNFTRDSCPNCMVDFGFHANYESIRPEIFDALGDFDCKRRPLYLVGHSLGAASLSYLLFDTLDQGYDVTHAYALESPRPGDAAFASALKEKVKDVDAWRVSHYRDIVVHLPPAAVLSYHHALPEIYYTSREGTDYKKCGVEELGCSDQWVLPWELTASDHMWYEQMNPCWCMNNTQTGARPQVAQMRRLLLI